MASTTTSMEAPGRAAWALFRDGLECTWGETWDPEPGVADITGGVPAFDGLTPGRKLALLAAVGEALRGRGRLEETATDAARGAVAAVFARIRRGVAQEVGAQLEGELLEEATAWRGRILEAAREHVGARGRVAGPVGRGTSPGRLTAESPDLAAWGELLGSLAGALLAPPSATGSAGSMQDPAAAPEPSGRPRARAGRALEAPRCEPRGVALLAFRARLRALCREYSISSLPEALLDGHHGLWVGPCTPGEIARESAACPLVGPDHVSEPGSFDCSYEEWRRLFRDETHRAARAADAAGGHLGPRLAAAAARSDHTGEPLELGEGARVMRLEGAWVVLDLGGGVLLDADRPCWSGPGDDQTPERFRAPRDAAEAFFRCRAIEDGDRGAHERALRRLADAGPRSSTRRP